MMDIVKLTNQVAKGSRVAEGNTPRRRLASPARDIESADGSPCTQTTTTRRPRRPQRNIPDAIIELQERQAELRIKFAEMSRQIEAAREAARHEMEHFRLMKLAMEIAARIMRGDNVPESDKNFLLRQSPGMYKLAMTARNVHNDDPKDHQPLARHRDRQSLTDAAAREAKGLMSSFPQSQNQQHSSTAQSSSGHI